MQLSSDSDRQNLTLFKSQAVLRSKHLGETMNYVFRQKSLSFTFAFVLMILGLTMLVTQLTMSFTQLRIVISMLIIVTIAHVALVVAFCLLEVIRLVNRSARLEMMIKLYVSTTFAFGLIAMLFNVVAPGKYIGIDDSHFSGFCRILKMYLDFCYYTGIL